MLTRRAILLLCLLANYSALAVSQNITIAGGFLASTALNTDSTSTWNTAFETYILAPADFSLDLSYTVTTGQEKLLIVTTTTTSSLPSTRSAPSASFLTSTIPHYPAPNSSTVSATKLAPTATLTPSLAIPTANRASIRHDTQYLSSAIVGLAAAIEFTMFLFF